MSRRRLHVAGAILATTGAALATARLLRFDPIEASALTLGLVVAVATALAGRRLVDRVGPRHAMDVAFPFAVLALVVFALREPLALPPSLALVTDPLAGAVAGLLWRGFADMPEPPGKGSVAGSAGLGVAAWLALLFLAGSGFEPVGYLVLAAAVGGAWWLLLDVPDPDLPGESPLAPYVPWGQVAGRSWPAWWRVPLRAPATIGYLALAWILFVNLDPPGINALDTERYEAFLYEIPDLSQAPLEAGLSMFSAPLLNHAPLQLWYVTVLLVLFGIAFEVREGSLRAMGVFAASGLVGSLVAGVLLHGLLPVFPDSGLLQHAWERTWSGGSAGAFGIMGALSARARRPAPLFGFFVFWELNVGAWYLQSYTPAFHLTALVTGYLLTRRLLEPHGTAT